MLVSSPLFHCPGRGAEYSDQPFCLSVCVSVCLSANISLEPLDRSAQNFVCRSPVAMARSSGGIVLRYVLPVLYDVTFGRNGHEAGKGWQHSAMAVHYAVIPGWSLMSLNACFICFILLYCKRFL